MRSRGGQRNCEIRREKPVESDITVVCVVESNWIVMMSKSLKLCRWRVTIVTGAKPLTGEVLKDRGCTTEPVVMLKYTWKFAAALSCQTAKTSVPETAKLELESSVTGPAVRSLLILTSG